MGLSHQSKEFEMKIYRYPVRPECQPSQQNFLWPPQNALPGSDFGVEQDFDWWLNDRPNMLVSNYKQADIMYIPIYWNRYYINHNWGKDVEFLVEEIERCQEINIPKFTIAEADVRVLKPQINWNDIIIFCASRRDTNQNIDIPLLSAPRPLPKDIPGKRYIASFLGNLETDGLRMAMREQLKHRTDCRIEHAGAPMEEFTRNLLESYIALAPRGQGAQSFRMYEAMQLGTVPLYISDIDCRPFKKWIDWDICSLYVPDVNGISEYLDVMMQNKPYLACMSEEALKTYRNQLTYGKWCRYVIQLLEEMA